MPARFPLTLALCVLPTVAPAADALVRLTGAPDAGNLVFQVYDSPVAFGELRGPAREYTLGAKGDGDYRLADVGEGDLVLVVYADENGNGLLDKSFIGFPREPIAISNDYQPKGPPSFSRASLSFSGADVREVPMSMYRVLGERGSAGVGIGVIGRSSPYVDAREDTYQVIPAITYFGERLQWFGPSLRYGLVGTGNVRLALTADYRIGSYEEDDADILAGLGDRDGTLMAGVSLQLDLPAGFDVEMSGQIDALDRIGGGLVTVKGSRGFQAGVVRFEPFVGATWLGDDLTNHDFGVPESGATPARPAYDTGSSLSYELGVDAFVELSERWLIIMTVAAEYLDDDVADSPIVDDDRLFKGFAAINYVF